MDDEQTETLAAGGLTADISPYATAAGMIASWELPDAAPRAHAMRDALVSLAASTDDDPSLITYTALGPLLILTAQLESELAAARAAITQLTAQSAK